MFNYQQINSIWKGVLYTVIATYLVSIGNIMSSHMSKQGIDVVSSTSWGLIYGGIISAIMVLYCGYDFTVILSVEYILSLLYLSIFCTAVAFILYLNLIKESGADKAAIATSLFPIVAIMISSVMQEYHFNLFSGIGIFLIFFRFLCQSFL
ncbi:DMT family transporter [Neisseria leonii]|uniref:DMT family transporter n=1 Tax=Neisseria leonii TaxID=2995413 RepID=A0A9X4IAJ9_9NEIS|nr:DMT family transporter [Neisseria sp. 51.81]MDD9327444.1 DMT family transporter [Neisseria sp. 51.81]